MKPGLIKQTLVASHLGVAGLRSRLWPSCVFVVSVASVVGVLLSMLSLTAGFLRMYHSGTDPALAIVVSANSQNEGDSHISRETAAVVLNAPGIARGSDGKPLADAEAFGWLNPDEASSAVGFVIRGVGPVGAALRPGLKIVAGRMFRTGARELIVGIGAQRVFGMSVGQKIILPNGDWSIVGVYSADGNVSESDLMADVDTLMPTMRISSFNSVIARLESPAALASFRHRLTANPALSVLADRQSDFYLRTETGNNTHFFNSIAYLVGITMALGALFGSVKILYSIVRARTREIATLRALGYEAFAVAASVIVQAIALCAIGALLGGAAAWAIFDGKLTWYYNNIFNLSVSPQLLALGLGWAVGIGVLGAVPPAVRAARLSVTDALREV